MVIKFIFSNLTIFAWLSFTVSGGDRAAQHLTIRDFKGLLPCSLVTKQISSCNESSTNFFLLSDVGDDRKDIVVVGNDNFSGIS